MDAEREKQVAVNGAYGLLDAPGIVQHVPSDLLTRIVDIHNIVRSMNKRDFYFNSPTWASIL